MMISLDKIITVLQTGKRPKGGAIESGVPSLGAEHLDSFGGFKLSKLKYVDEDFFSKMKSGVIQNDDIIIVKDGATTGKVSFVNSDFPLDRAATNEHVYILRLKKEANSKYVFYHLFSSIGKSQILEDFRGATVGGISKSFTKNIRFLLPALTQQQKIVDILDAANTLRQNDKALIAKYDELTSALFMDMFGDPVSNPKGWELVSLSQYGSFKNGLNFNKNESGTILKYLGVGDFKSKSKIDDVGNLTNIELNSLPNIGYLLKDGDLVFVRSNGNKALVGRCIEVYPNETKLTFSGFCIRYRITSSYIKPTYLAQLFRNKSFKNLMLESGQGANIQNINQQILSGINVPLPPLNLQNQFVERITLIEEQVAIAQSSLIKSEELFNSLLQKAFKGELV